MRATIGLLLLAGSFVVSSCKSQASTICGLECDCEHCNDYESDIRCDERNAEHDVADSYGCVNQWETWATCYEDHGSCDAKTATYSTVAQSAGSCTGLTDTMMPCPNGTTDCAGLGSNAVCDAGTCKFKSCTGTANPCSTNAECTTTGTDRCAKQQKALSDCIDKASAHGGTFGTGGQTSTGAAPG